MNMLDHAIGYARRGLLVFALKPRDKVPATMNGCKDGTTDEAAVRAMWGDPGRNIGIAMGIDSGVFALDVDGPEGAKTLEMWQAVYGALPPTPTAETARGRHLYFRHPGEQVAIRNSARKVGEGIDVRTDGGYLVAPPSVHPSGDVYRWADGCSPDDLSFAVAPDWLIKRLVDKPKPVPQEPAQSREGHTRYGQKALDAECMDLQRTGEGGRNQKLNAVAFRVGQLVAAGHLGEGAALSDLRRSARAAGLDEGEIRATVASGFNAGMSSPNASDPRPEQYAPREQAEPEQPPPAGDEPAAPTAASQPAAAPKPDAFPVLSAYETAKHALDYITDPSRAKLPKSGFDKLDEAIGGMPPGTMHVIGGRTGSGKSSLMLAMALKQNAAGQRIGIVSCEDAEWIWGARLLASLQGIDIDEFFSESPSDYTIGLCVRGVQEARDKGVHFAFPIGRPIKFIVDAITRLVKREGCNVIMVDYLQAIAAKGQDRYVARTDCAQEMKGVCHELGVPLVLASQLKRSENGPFKPPTNNDLKDSGDIENMAESILLMWPLSDEERAPVIGKVTKVKWSPKRPKFAVQRHPTSGAVTGLIDPPRENAPPPTRGDITRDDAWR